MMLSITYLLLHYVPEARFFTAILSGRDAPIGNPGGAGKIGPIRADTAFVASYRR
ncbi:MULTISPECIES: hypothetical protein [unclassified Frankia]